MAHRSLPHFLGIGPPKTATTWLHHVLDRHPDVFVPAIKETCFFVFEGMPEVRIPGLTIVTTLDAYTSLFAPARPDQILGESSPLYFVSDRTPRRIAELAPSMKLIATLRDPAARAYSEYMMNVRNGIEHRTFEEAIAEEPRSGIAFAANHYRESRVVRNGLYASHLRRFFDHFPRAQIQVHLFDDLLAAPDRCLTTLCAWLGIDAARTGALPGNPNPGRVPRSRSVHRLLTQPGRVRDAVKAAVPGVARRMVRDVVFRLNMHTPPSPFTPRVRRLLADRFHDDIVALEALIGQDLRAWRRPIDGV